MNLICPSSHTKDNLLDKGAWTIPLRAKCEIAQWLKHPEEGQTSENMPNWVHSST